MFVFSSNAFGSLELIYILTSFQKGQNMKGNDGNVMEKMGEKFQCHFNAKGMVGDIGVVKIDMTQPFCVRCHIGVHLFAWKYTKGILTY